MDNRYIVLVALVLIAIGVFRRIAGFLKPAPLDQVRTLLAGGARLVDVRTPAEYAQDHYSGAINIPLDQLQNRIDELGKRDDPLVLYCATGLRSGRAVAQLRRAGFRSTLNAGGLSRLRNG